MTTMAFMSAYSAGIVFLFKMTLLLTAALLLHGLLARKNPRWRVLVCRGTLIGLVLLPLSIPMLPGFSVSVPQPISFVTPVIPVDQTPLDGLTESHPGAVSDVQGRAAAPVMGTETVPVSSGVTGFRLRPWLERHFSILLCILWATINAFMLGRMMLGVLQIRRLMKATRPAPPSLHVLMHQIAGELNCTCPVLLQVTDRVKSPFLTGIRHPAMVLPEKMIAGTYSEDLPAILAHELSHLKTQDLFWMGFARILSMVYCFHPLAWILRSAHASACESVCDAVAADYVGGASTYSQTLARVALEMVEPVPVGYGVPMLRTAEVTRRIHRLRHGIKAAALSRKGAGMVLGIGLAAIIALGGVKLVRAEGKAVSTAIKTEDKQSKSVNESKNPSPLKLDGEVTVKVVDEEGKPVARARITPYIYRIKSNPQILFGWSSVSDEPIITNEEGMAKVLYPKYDNENQVIGAIDFSVMHPQYLTYKTSGYKVDATESPIRLEQGGTVKITPIIPSDIKASGKVYPHLSFNNHSNKNWQLLPDGTLQISSFPTGRHPLRIVRLSKDGPTLFSEPLNVDVKKGQTISEKLVLKPGIRVRGKLSTNVSKPVSNGIVIARIFSDEPVGGKGNYKENYDFLDWKDNTPVQADGSFEFKSLPTGYGEFIALCDGFVSEIKPDSSCISVGIPQRFTIEKDNAEIAIKMIPTASCDVIIKTSDGKPVKKIMVDFVQMAQWHNCVSEQLGMSVKSENSITLSFQENNSSTKIHYLQCWNAATNVDGVAHISNLLPGLTSYCINDTTYELPGTDPRTIRSKIVELVSGKTVTDTATVYPKGTAPKNDPPSPVSCRPDNRGPSLPVHPDTETGIFSGKVVDKSGKPIEGVLVNAWDWSPGDETKTDAQGHFRLEKLDGTDNSIEVRFSKDGYAPLLFAYQPIGVLDNPLVMDDKTYFEGKVTLPDGSPAANVLIRANQGPKDGPGVRIDAIWTETRSGADGRYRLLVQDDTFELQVRDEKGNAARLPDLSIAKDEVKPLDIALKAGIVFRAKLVDAQSEKPVPGVRLWHWHHPGIEGRSNNQGEIEIKGMFPGKFEFDVEGSGYTRWWSEQYASEWSRLTIDVTESGWQRNFDSLDFDLKEGMEPVIIKLERGVRIRGRVLDPEDKPVGGATVAPAKTGSGNSLTGDTRFSVESKADGTFEMLLPASNSARYNLVVHDGKFQEWRTWANGVGAPFQTRPGDQLNDVTLHLTRPGVVKGKVVDPAGKPVANCEVRASAKDTQENRYYDPTTKTDKDGLFTLRFVRAGEQYIQAAPFWLRASEAPEGTTQTVTVEAGKTVEGVSLVAKPR